MCVRQRGDGTECLTGGGDQADLGADRALPSLAERAHLNDVGAPLGQRQHGGGVDGPRHLPVAPPLLFEQHLRGVFKRTSPSVGSGPFHNIRIMNLKIVSNNSTQEKKNYSAACN